VKEWFTKQESLLEIGLVGAGMLLLVAVVVLIFGHTHGAIKHWQGRAQVPPSAGSVLPERHQNIVATSTR